MIRRSTWIAVAVLIVLLGVTWYFEWSPAGLARVKGTATPTLIPQIIKENQSDISLIEFTASTGDVTTLRKNSDNTWSFPNSTSQVVDQGKMQELLSDIYFLTPLTTMDSNTSLDAYGLLKPAQILKLEVTNGSPYVIKLGSLTPTQSGYYVQVNSNPAIIVSKTSLESILDLIGTDALIQKTATPPSPNGSEITGATPSPTPASIP
jgi:hypothetical protein